MTDLHETKISFIIIGKNEGWKITQCIESIYKATDDSKLGNFEIIYVDSKSSDDSLQRARNFSDIKIFQISGHCNAAIARNIGAKESSGTILCFLDGDMEIMPDYIDEIHLQFTKNHKFISGQIEEYLYDKEWKYLEKRNIFSENKLNKYDLTNGGAFVIERNLWEMVNGMRNKFDRSQDIDLNYRLIKKGYPIFRTSKTYVKHHTVQYNYNLNLKKEFSLFRNYLYRGLLLRESLFDIKLLKRNIRINYTLFMLILSFLLACFIYASFLFLYIIIISVRAFSQYQRFRKAVKSNPLAFLLKIVYVDFNGIFGALFFYPKNYPISYVTIQ